MPALEIPAQLLVEHAGSHLQQMVGTRWGSPHLLCPHKPLADNLVDGGLDEAGRDGLAVPLAVRIVRDRRQVSGHVIHELFKFVLHRLCMFGFSTDLPRRILKCLQCPMRAAVPEIGFRTAQDCSSVSWHRLPVRLMHGILPRYSIGANVVGAARSNDRSQSSNLKNTALNK